MADDEQCPWKPTAQNLRRWKLLQTSNAFLQDAQDRGSLSCHYCKKGPLCVYRWDDPSQANAPDKATVDHVIPLAAGGADIPSNMVVSCYPCNAAKGCK